MGVGSREGFVHQTTRDVPATTVTFHPEVGDEISCIMRKAFILPNEIDLFGGDEGIRTLETVPRLHP